VPGRRARLGDIDLLNVEGMARNKPLEVVDRHPVFNQNATAHGLTRMRADPSHGQRKRVLLLDEPECLKISALGDEADISLDIDVGRTGQRTGGDAVSIMTGELEFQDMFAVCPHTITLGRYHHAVFCGRGTGPQKTLPAGNLNHAHLTGMFPVVTQSRDGDTRTGGGIE